jgi:hypothetical protein
VCLAPSPGSSVLTTIEVSALWLQYGGDPNKVVEAVAIAAAESGYDALAQSGACCNGLWQICEDHALEWGFDPSQLYDPRVNVWAAIQLSGNGTNWAPFDTAYADLSRAAQRYPISYPEVGSPAYNLLAEVASALGVTGGGGSGLPTGGQTYSPPSSAPPIPGFIPGQQPGAPYIPPPGGVQTGPQFFQLPPTNAPQPQSGGWDNLVRYWTQDAQQLIQQDQQAVYLIAQAAGGQQWPG